MYNNKEEEKPQADACAIRPDVLTYDDVVQMAPFLSGHRRLVERAFKLLDIDKVNAVHRRWCSTPGIDFSRHMIHDDFKIRLRVDGLEVLDRFPSGAFVTVSNHPFGALDGIMLLDIVGSKRPDYKVMVNMILNHIQAMRPSFIAVDPQASDDPEKKRTTMAGLRRAMRLVSEGHPMGFFPAGAVSKVRPNLHVADREWQPSVMRLIRQFKVPVVPIFFHGHNSLWFNFLGLISWKIRTLRLPAEVFRCRGKEKHVSIGQPISVERQASCSSLEEFTALLRGETYALAKNK